jgi:hypothetical protein
MPGCQGRIALLCLHRGIPPCACRLVVDLPECVDVARLVLAGQALLIASAVLADVLGVGLGQLLNSSHDGLRKEKAGKENIVGNNKKYQGKQQLS